MSRIPAAEVTAPALASLVQRVIRERGQLGELYPVLLRSPSIAAGMIELGNGVRRDAALPAVLRELVICRVGVLNGANYEVMRHQRIAAGLGVSNERLEAITAWPGAGVFTPQERAVLAYADAMTTQVRVPDDVFASVRDSLPEQEVLELTVTVAYYNMISRILVALEIGAEPARRQS